MSCLSIEASAITLENWIGWAIIVTLAQTVCMNKTDWSLWRHSVDTCVTDNRHVIYFNLFTAYCQSSSFQLLSGYHSIVMCLVCFASKCLFQLYCMVMIVFVVLFLAKAHYVMRGKAAAIGPGTKKTNYVLPVNKPSLRLRLSTVMILKLSSELNS